MRLLNRLRFVLTVCSALPAVAFCISALPAAADEPAEGPKQFAVLIGVGQDEQAPPLSDSVRSILGLSQTLRRYAGYRSENLLLLVDSAVAPALHPRPVHIQTQLAGWLSKPGRRSLGSALGAEYQTPVAQAPGGEFLLLAVGNAVLAGGLFYMIFRLIVGFPFRKSRYKPHSLGGLAWVIGAHFLSFGLIGPTDIAAAALAFLLVSPVAMVFIYHKLNQAYEAEQARKPLPATLAFSEDELNQASEAEQPPTPAGEDTAS